MRRLAPLALAGLLASSAPALVDLYATDFDAQGGWTFWTGHSSTAWGAPAWDVDALPADPAIIRSAPSSLNFNHDVHGLVDGTWDGTARSPVVDLGRALADPELSFWYTLYGEGGCNVWVDVSARIVHANSGAVLFEECISDEGVWGTWVEIGLPLDRTWGRVQVELHYDSWEAWNSGFAGLSIEDLRITDPSGAAVECEGEPQTGGAPGAALELSGSASISTGALTLAGSGFPSHTFASAFVGTAPARIPIAAGVRCISPAGSQRLWIAPTRAAGAPSWTLELGAAPLTHVATVGLPLYVQTIYRDGPSANFSSALVFTPAP